MIKFETLGMITNSKNDPTLKSDADVKNYSFITVDGDLYLISNTITGDDSYVDDIVIKAGEPLDGFYVKAFEGQKLVVDDKHITYASGKKYADITVGTLLSAKSDGTLEIVAKAPASGVYFKVTDKVTLTGNAVKAKVMVAVATTTTAP